MAKYQIKRIYDAPSSGDGYRVLVDRLWPRGVSKQKAELDDWQKELAPSADLRKWFDHKSERFEEFSNRYQAELETNSAVKDLLSIAQQHKTVSLLYGTRDPEINHAKVLLEYLTAST